MKRGIDVKVKVQHGRIRMLDILRGFAILGTLGTNIWLFANLGDLSYVLTLDRPAWWTSLDEFIRVFVLFFVNGKFLSILAILFGVGLELKYRQSLRKGSVWPGLYIWTSLILLAEGLIHFTLVMEYDILMSYAVTAIIVSFIVKRGDKAIQRVMAAVLVAHVSIVVLLFGAMIAAHLAGANLSLSDMSEVVTLYKDGTWMEQVHYRLSDFWILRSEVIFVIPLNVFLFLFGIRLMRAGAFSPEERGRRIRRKMLNVGLVLGFPLNLLILVPGGMFDLPVRYLFAPLMAVGYMAFIAKLVEWNPSFKLWVSVERIGKMALSCYILQNVLSSFLFYGWGLGLGGKVDALTTVLVWFAMSVCQLGIASLWLRYFRFGPMEWLRRYIASLPAGGRMHDSKAVPKRPD